MFFFQIFFHVSATDRSFRRRKLCKLHFTKYTCVYGNIFQVYANVSLILSSLWKPFFVHRTIKWFFILLQVIAATARLRKLRFVKNRGVFGNIFQSFQKHNKLKRALLLSKKFQASCLGLKGLGLGLVSDFWTVSLAFGDSGLICTTLKSTSLKSFRCG